MCRRGRARPELHLELRLALDSQAVRLSLPAYRDDNGDHLAALLALPALATAEERRAAWRQGMATLAHEASAQTPVPLEGLSPEGLARGVRVALDEGLLDDLGFLEPAPAAAAVYELATALPAGAEKRELGRRVLVRLQEGDAPTFVALATSLALGASRVLAGPGVRARVALSLDLPIGAGARADALALALISRRELVPDWLGVPSTGSLASRRLAGRLLERAAREAARRAAQGDDAGVRVFEGEQVTIAWSRLLSDREPLVWRHVAVARGLLSRAVPRLAEQIERELRAAYSPTEWRRAAVSLAARVAVAPRPSLAVARELLAGEVPKRDPGVGAAMILGLARAAEVEPAVADTLLELCVRGAGAPVLEVAESIVELRRERVSEEVGEWAIERVRAQLRDVLDQPGSDDGRIALARALSDELAPESARGALTLRERIAEAQRAFAEQSARAAYLAARDVVGAVDATIARLERADLSSSAGRQRAARDVRELDAALLETSALSDLLLLGGKTEREGITALSSALGRLATLLLAREGAPLPTAAPHPTLHLRQLRALLHLVDADGGEDDDAGARRTQAAVALFARIGADATQGLRRMLLATLARAVDGLVRQESCELSDALVAIWFELPRRDDVTIVAEASMAPDLQVALRAWVTLAEQPADAVAVETLFGLARALPPASSPRVEALRGGLLRLAQSLAPLFAAQGLAQLVSHDGTDLLGALDATVPALAQRLRGARRRFGLVTSAGEPASRTALRLVEGALAAALEGDPGALSVAVPPADRALTADLPAPLAALVSAALAHVAALPAEPPEGAPDPRTLLASSGAGTAETALPPWLPPSRILGGFYVLRALGRGAGGTVFVACRADERHDAEAERFALKVPEYDGAAARTLSEKEFLRLFREEAGALLALPAHANLATLVTFDAGARPKPVLVMELVEGPSLERRIQQRALDLELAFSAIDGVAAGLEAMHAAELGHLDVKPSNIILRPARTGFSDPPARSGLSDAPARAGASVPPPRQGVQAVLVDFGLSGRKLRPGCATAHYGAPEIWGLVPKGHEPLPAAADVYAFACVAYEVLVGRTLFSGHGEVALLRAQLAHDGMPEGLAALAAHDAASSRLAAALSAGLRRDPRQRVDIATLRTSLATCARELAGRAWPLPVAASG